MRANDVCPGSGTMTYRHDLYWDRTKAVRRNSMGIARCPVCNRRLKARAKFCVGGEYLWDTIPPHKARKFPKKIKNYNK